MEKFAVDLEKVLDEFEYNEEREENVSAQSIRNSPMPHLGIGALRQVPPVRPPAASYRRPSFEPINLADADFAASPPKSSGQSFSRGISGKKNETEGTLAFLSNKAQSNNRNYIHTEENVVSSINNEVNINKQLLFESEDTSSSSIWQSNNSLSNDEKPDLLEYNLKNADIDSNNEEINNQLPDITTSVRTSTHGVNNNEIDKLSNSLDLISSASGLSGIDEFYQHEVESEKDEAKDAEISPDLAQIVLSHDLENHLSVNATLKGNEIEESSKDLLPFSEPDLNTSNIINSDKEDITSLNNPESYNDLQQSEKIGNLLETNSNFEKEGNSQLENDLVLSNEITNNIENILPQDSVVEDGVTIDSIVNLGFQSDLPEIKTLIGFSIDSELSESEVEQYLKELEELETLTSDRVSELEVKSVNEEIGSNIEKIFETSSQASIINLNDTGSSNSNTNNNTCNESKGNEIEGEEELKNDIIVDNVYSNKDNLCSSTLAQSEFKENMSEEDSVLQQNAAVNADLYKLTYNLESLEYNPETTNNSLTLSSCEVDEKCIDTPSSIKSTNQHQEENKKEQNTTKEIKSLSTNPFDEDYSLVSNNEAETKTTNPFEVDDNENSKKDNDVEPSRTSKAINDEVQLSSSDKTNQTEASNPSNVPVDSTENTQMTSETDVSSCLNADISIESFVDHSDSVYKSLSDIQDSTSDVRPEARNDIPVENVSAECLPSCSSLESETLDKSASTSAQNIDEAGIPAEEDRPLRPSSLELPRKITVEANPVQSPITGELERELGPEDRRLGKIPPFWIPDTDTTMCMQCQVKFTVIKRRHHCRACGQVLCNKCCGLRARLEYKNFTEEKVCQPCFTILEALNAAEATSPLRRQPNPNNPMEYCSTIPPLQQAAGSLHQPPPSVMVPVGVLKREGRKSDVTKQVMFSDGIRPGGDLTELDGSGEPRIPFRRPGRLTKRVGTPPGGMMSSSMRRLLDPNTHSFIPAEGDSSLPPVVNRLQGEVTYSDLESPISLNQPVIKFALNRNLFVIVKRVLLDCCVNRECWCFSSEGLACVGQDEIVFLLECLPQETLPPKHVFLLINSLYQDAAKGSTVSEMTFTPAMSNNLLNSRDHGGFLYIRTSYQCTAQLALPSPPYLVALLIHRWETPWARLFPIRLVLRMGAEFRYYPCPLVSVRDRPPLYTEIGHTIINILADFRKYSYSLPSVRGLVIHMEDRQTTINIPRNRYDQVVRALNNSNDSVLAFGANLSLAADSHLVCMQSTEDENTSYHTQAINIHNKPRRVTGASFVVFNGALKVPGLAGKSSIVEDGLMVQVPSETMVALRTALRDMRDYSIGCGPNAEETVVLQWTADDTNFNIGVKSCVDGRPLDGVPSIRVHNGTDYSGGTRIIRWTEVFILQCEDSDHSNEPLDISRLSESIARATCLALVPLLDLLSAASLTTLAVRTTIHPDNVGYEAGSNGEKLPPLYMKSLDDELVAVVHQAALASQESPAVLELIFRIMEQG
ncbi:zinc finger FYVE domain-containing protein 16-like isoform X2 [Homalodisca vitripennis]|uniref:zinc finger FYVE domain-containing protein 16-like isoform X2 n=1 Tax=Homalodisca vitripennis TaxID=197043 RepID=UPI001EEB55F7|nr:zinc finger FYVE domain-containing protein 16-like isoform X2 [Homalodisca vitripennis]